MDDAVADVLKTIGWDTGFRLPIANEENQTLERELAHLVIKKSAMTKEYDDSAARCQNLTDHLKYVRVEVQQNQNLLSNYRQQLDNENHKLKLKQAERDNITAEIRKMAKQTADINERLSSKKCLLARNVTKLEKIKAEAEWDAEAMKAWEESVKKRDEDNELLQKFSQEDQRKVLELENRRKCLQTEISGHKGILAKMDVDVLNYEQVMMRTGKMLSELRDERQALVRQWQESVKNLRQKDMDIKRAHHNLDMVEESIKTRREEVEEQEDFLSNEKNNNKYLQIEINEVNATNIRLRREYHTMINQNYLLLSEQAAQKKLVERAALDMQKVQLELKQATKVSQHYEVRIDKLRKDIAELSGRTTFIMRASVGAVKNADVMDGLIKDAEKKGHLYTRRMQTLLNKQYKMNSATTELVEIGNVKKAEVCALENALGQIRKRSAVANQALIHKKQLLSDLEMKVACLEAQIGNTDPDDIQDFQEMWNIRITELEEVMAEHTEVKNLLHGQILKLQKENLRLVNAISNDSNSQQVLRDKLQSLVLQIEGGMKQTKAATLRTQQQQVSENVLKLKVDKLQKAMSHADKEIYNLQRYKIDLESTLKERHIEVNIAKDVLFAKKKNLEEDRGRLRADISTRSVRIQQLENKYQLSLGLLGKDESGEPMSIATFKIRAAQERYELQQEGDELDKKIRKAEHEIVAMENTLKVVNMTNSSFKNSLTMVEQDSLDAAEMKSMQDTLILQTAALKDRKQELFVKVDHHNDLKQELERCEEAKNKVKDELRGLEDTLAKMLREETDRKEKIDRATRQIANCKKKIDSQQLERYDRELYIKQLQDTNKNVLYQLADFGAQYPEVIPVLSRYMEAQRLEMPKCRSSFTTISSDSIRSPSSISSTASTNRAERERPSLANITSLELKFDETAAVPSCSGTKPKEARSKK